MISLITAGLVALGLVLRIVIWFGSSKRKRESRKTWIVGRIKQVEYEMGKALQDSDTVRVSVLSHELRELRQEYGLLNRQR